jgi:hypothetical protein
MQNSFEAQYSFTPGFFCEISFYIDRYRLLRFTYTHVYLCVLDFLSFWQTLEGNNMKGKTILVPDFRGLNPQSLAPLFVDL